MFEVSYVLPDTLGGDPAGRERLARVAGCDLVEVAIGDAPPPSLPWILRAASVDEDGRDLPRWHDRAWTSAFIAGLARIAGRPPAAVVIEPGSEWNRPSDIIQAIASIHEGLSSGLWMGPTVLVATCDEQSIPDGAAVAELWDHVIHRFPDLALHAGIALDASAFYAATRTRMAQELALVPPDALRYVRVHVHGKKPDLADPLPWRSIFDLVRRAPGAVLIAPAVEDQAALEPAILFCMVSLQSRAFT